MKQITAEGRIVLRKVEGEGRKLIVGIILDDSELDFPEGEMFQATITISPYHHWVPKGNALKGVDANKLSMILNKQYAWDQKE